MRSCDASSRLRTNGTEHSHGTFSTSNNTTSATSQLVDGFTSINGDAWELGVNHALFENVQADGSGEITFDAAATVAGVLDGSGRRLHINGFQIENVFVMAGIPVIMQAMASTLDRERLGGGDPVRSRTIGAYLGESQIASQLAAIQERHPDIGRASPLRRFI